jgi:hypothetical protein
MTSTNKEKYGFLDKIVKKKGKQRKKNQTLENIPDIFKPVETPQIFCHFDT